MDCNLPVHEISSAGILEWVADSISKGSSCPRDETCISCIAGRFFTSEPPRRPTKHLRLYKILVFTQCLPTTETFSSVQSLSHVQLFVTPRTAAHQASLSFTSPGACSNSGPLSQRCHPTVSSSIVPFSSCLQSFPAPGSFPLSRLCIRWPKYWNFSFNISPSNEYSGLISFRIGCFDLLAV